MKIALPTLIAAVAVAGVAFTTPADTMEGHTSVSPQDIKWGPAPAMLPPGAEAAVLFGDPSKEGLFVLRLRFPAGYSVAPHGHPVDEVVTELPDHPGVIHYLLHAYDNTPYASRGLTAALRLPKVAPSSPHALQFPAHIFNRMGLWRESIATNQAGAAVDDLFFKPHAMDFLVHSYLQTGQAVAA